MMKMSTANGNDKEAIKKVWRAAFGDPEFYIDFYLNSVFLPQNTYVAKDGDEIVAILTAIDTVFHNKESSKNGSYLYALATLPEYQGKGVMTELEDYATQKLTAQGKEFMCLNPAYQSIVAYYQKRNYCTVGYMKLVLVEEEEQKSCAFAKLSKEGFVRRRDTFLQSKHSYFVFTDLFKQYLYDEAKFVGCEILGGTIGETSGYFVGYKDGSTFFIKASTFTVKQLQEGVSYIKNLFDVDKVKMRMYSNTPDDFFSPFLMVKPLNGTKIETYENAYMNLFLD